MDAFDSLRGQDFRQDRTSEIGKVSYKSLKLHDFSSKEAKHARVDFRAKTPYGVSKAD